MGGAIWATGSASQRTATIHTPGAARGSLGSGRYVQQCLQVGKIDRWRPLAEARRGNGLNAGFSRLLNMKNLQIPYLDELIG
jgi:hypothetical protein